MFNSSLVSEEEQLLIYEYTELLLGNNSRITTSVFGENSVINEERALKLLRICLTIFLENINPHSIKIILTEENIKRLKLEGIIENISMPPEINEKDYGEYIASRLYPSQIVYKQEERAVDMYKDILSGKIGSFKRGYFDGSDGRNRAISCFRYLINNHYSFDSVRDMYEYFGSKDGQMGVKKMGLKQALVVYYDTPLEMLHDTLPEIDKNEFYYIYYTVLMDFGHDRNGKSSGYRSDLDPEVKIRTMEETRENRTRSGKESLKNNRKKLVMESEANI